MSTPSAAEAAFAVLPTTSPHSYDLVDQNGVVTTVSVDTLRLGCIAGVGFYERAAETCGWSQTTSTRRSYKSSWHMPGVGHVSDYRYADGRSFLNLETRPNEDDPWDLLRTFLSPIAIRRVDIALDYGSDLSGYLFDAKQLKRTVHSSSTGTVETTYLGSEKSAKRFRIYDKGAELSRRHRTKVHGPLWRIEAQLRREYASALPDDLFDGLVVRSWPPVGDPDLRTAAYLEYAYRHPGIQRAFSKKTRETVVAMLGHYTLPLDPAPADVYRACLPALRSGLASILSSSDHCPAAVVS